MTTDNWKTLEFPDKDELIKARHQFHQAIQNVGCVGRSFLPASSGDVNANLDWDAKLQRLASRWITGELVFRSSFSLSEFSVYLVDELFHTISYFPLQGKKQIDVMIWLEEQIDMLGLDSSQLSLKLPYEIPEYPTAKREAFQVDSEVAGKEFEALFHNTNLVLKKVVDRIEGASEIKCWPHHFDIASLITLADTGDPETSKSINLGMSPGDSSYDEPYFYISPWPYPVEELPDISATGGFWHEHNWVGAVLRVSDIRDKQSAGEQHDAVLNFFQQGLRALMSIIKV